MSFLIKYARIDTSWGISSVGRALDWQSRGQGFKSLMLHHKNHEKSKGLKSMFRRGSKLSRNKKNQINVTRTELVIIKNKRIWVFYLFSSTYSIFSLSITESGIILLVI